MYRLKETVAILLLDESKIFAERFSASVRDTWNERISVTCSAAVDAVSDREIADMDICLFSHRYANALQARVWPAETRFFLLCDTTTDHTVSRFLPANDILTHITGGLDLTTGPARRCGSIDLVMAFDRTARDRWVRQKLQGAVTAGSTVYVIPMMPSYLVTHPLAQGVGDNVSDFLLSIEAGVTVEDKQFGHLFALHEWGHLQTRQPVHADDLVTAAPAALEILMQRLRARIDAGDSAGYGLVICDSLPLDTIGRLAAYADRLLIDSDDSGTAPVDADLTAWLASLSASTAVRPLTEA